MKTVVICVGRRKRTMTGVVVQETKRRVLVRLASGLELWAYRDERNGLPHIIPDKIKQVV